MTRMKFTPVWIALSACTVFASCSKVDSNDLKEEIPYYQTYEVAYDKNDNTTEATASFRVREASGAKVELTNNAGVTLNGIQGQTGLTDKTTYKWDLSGLSDAQFVLTKNSGETFTNNVQRSSAVGDIEIVNLPDSVSKANGFTFSWTGSPLGSDESIKAVLGSTLGVNIYSKNVSGNQVTFSSAEMNAVPIGNIRVTLKRQKELSLQAADGNAGGMITVSVQTSKDAKVID